MGEIDDAARRRRGRSFDERMLAAIGELDSWPLSYKLIASVAIVLAGLALRLLVLSPLGPRLAYITFFPMVIVATVAFGTYAAVLTTLLSVALAHAFVSPLRDSWDWLGAGLFVVGNVFVALLAGLLHRARDRLKTAGLERERDQALRQFVEQTPVAIAMFDRQMRYLAASRRWISDYGLAEPIIGRSHYEVFPEIPEAWKQVHRRGIAGELVRNDEDAFERADGSIQYLRWEVRPWRAGAGDIGGILIFTEDITQRKLSEAALRASNEELSRFNSVMVDRELRMIELKREINDFRAAAGLPPEYDLDFPIEKT